MSYFEALQHDWDTLGFGFDIPRRPSREIAPKDTESYSQLHHLMINLSLNVASIHHVGNKNHISAEPAMLDTELGRRLLFLCQLPHFDNSVDRWICGDAEPAIASLLDLGTSPHPDIPLPTIVMNDGEISGMMGQYKDEDMFYYSMHDNEKTGTYARHVYRIAPPPVIDQPTPGQVGAVELEELHSYIDKGRLTFFSMPVSARRQITFPHYLPLLEKSLSTPHDAIVESANSLLDRAEPIAIAHEKILAGFLR